MGQIRKPTRFSDTTKLNWEKEHKTPILVFSFYRHLACTLQY